MPPAGIGMNPAHHDPPGQIESGGGIGQVRDPTQAEIDSILAEDARAVRLERIMTRKPPPWMPRADVARWRQRGWLC